MNCREAQNQIFAERDGAPDDTRRAALAGHVAECPRCRKIRDDLAAAFIQWRTEVEKTPVPDADREWYAVRRRIRGGVEAGAEVIVRPRRNLLTWIAIPVGAAAALALSFSVVLRNSPPTPVPTTQATKHVASVDSVETGKNSSPMVFVDDKSGWVIVWASDTPKQG